MFLFQIQNLTRYYFYSQFKVDFYTFKKCHKIACFEQGCTRKSTVNWLETINIFCNDSLHHTISAGTSSTIISLPNECNIISKTIKVSKLENDHHNVTFTVNNEFKIFPIKINPWRPFHREIIDNITTIVEKYILQKANRV